MLVEYQYKASPLSDLAKSACCEFSTLILGATEARGTSINPTQTTRTLGFS